MKRYLRNFSNHSSYTSYINSQDAILPNVSHCDEEDEVHYNPYVDPSGGHAFVEIGGIKWATMNIGAESVTDYGNYYQYGKGADTYQQTSSGTDYSGLEDPLAISADTAAQVWGGSWRMPTLSDFQALIDNTDYEYVTIDGVNGGKFTDKTDNSKYVFFPAAGFLDYNGSNFVGTSGVFWSGTPYDSSKAYNFGFSRYSFGPNQDYRFAGLTVRAVLG